jgi:hypothetical protein
MNSQRKEYNKDAHGQDSRSARPEQANALAASPASLLSGMRGSIAAARVAHPDVLQVEILDSKGGLWRLASQYAQWLPSDPGTLLDLDVEDSEIRLADGVL